MLKNKYIAALPIMASCLCLLTVSSTQSARSLKKNGFEISKLRVGLNKAFAATPAGHHQEIYDFAKDEVNNEVQNLIDGINTQLKAAAVSSCDDIPAVSTTAFHTSQTYDLYSSAVGGHTFPISTITGVSFDVKLDLKLSGSATTVGSLYVDCDTGAAEVRYMGRTDTVTNSDTDIIIAYHEDESSGRQSILMASSYDASPGNYVAGKMAIHYIENSSTQTINYAYASDAVTGLRGTLTANASGVVTDAVDGDVSGNTAASDLNTMTGLSSYTVANINSLTVSL